MSPRTNRTRSSRALSLAQYLAPLLASCLISYGTAQFRAGAQETSTGLKIGALEEKYSQLDRSLLPRAEAQAQWSAVEQLLTAQQQDLRELRTTQKEILFRLSSK